MYLKDVLCINTNTMLLALLTVLNRQVAWYYVYCLGCGLDDQSIGVSLPAGVEIFLFGTASSY